MSPGNALYLGLDLGTSGCRLIAIDDAGEVQAELRRPWPEPAMRGLSCQEDAERWWREVSSLLGGISQHIEPRRIHSLALDGTSSTLLLTDAAGKPLSPALMYKDARGRAEAECIQRHAPPQSAARGATSSLAKLLHLAPHHPQARHALHQADWVCGRLLGRYGDSDENNSLKLGYDVERRCWPQWLLNLLQRQGINSALLPQVHPPATPLGTLSASLARAWGWPKTVQIRAGTTDSTAGFLASGACEAGDAVTMLGSTLVLKILSGQPVFAPQYGIYSHRLGDKWLAGGASNSGGAVLLHYFSREELQQLTPQLKPEQPLGLDYYPLLGPGERFPHADPAYPPRLEPRPDEPRCFFQAMLEGMTEIEAQGYALLRQLGAAPLRRLYTTGGGSVNPAWGEMRQRRMGLPLTPPRHTEAAYGAALLAREGLARF